MKYLFNYDELDDYEKKILWETTSGWKFTWKIRLFKLRYYIRKFLRQRRK